MKRNILTIIIFWLTIVGLAFSWNYYDQGKAADSLALQTAKAFFKQIVLTRSWNATHGGVYVPVTEVTLPNPYLDHPARDVVTTKGVHLTMVNPAYMTRQISEIAIASDAQIQFHITSLNPIRPENAPLEWEKKWLNEFEKGVKEKGAFVSEKSKTKYRYMAPLYLTQGCLKCHAEQGYKLGDVRGGISVTLPENSSKIPLALILGYGIAGVVGVFFIIYKALQAEKQRKAILAINTSLEQEVQNKQQAYEQLKEATEEVETLQGIIPICMHCKCIRDDKGYWNRIEKYIQSHSSARFSHSICDDCMKEHYPD